MTFLLWRRRWTVRSTHRYVRFIATVQGRGYRFLQAARESHRRSARRGCARTPPIRFEHVRCVPFGDVRCSSVKRVASAVGEGSIAIRLVHELWGGKSQSARPQRTFALLQDEQGRRIAVSLRELLVQAIPSRQPRSRSTRALTSRSSTRLSKAAGYLPRRTGRVVGFWGLAISEMDHHFRAEGGKPVHAWCALDPFLIVPVIGLRARVESKRPGNRRANHSPTSTLASANRQGSASAPHADNIELPYRRSLGMSVQLVGVAFE
jgi:hypothetical protein